MTKKQKSMCWIFILLLNYFCFAEQAADSLTTSKSRYYYLEGIKVIAERPEEAIGKIEIKSYDPEVINTELNLGEAVSNITGIDLTTGGKSGSNIKIRGFNDRQIKIMIDGNPVSGGYFGEVDLNTLPISDIKEVQLLKGPISSLYGTDTMGGVVNFITRLPTGKPSLKTGFLAKRNNTNKVYLTSSGSFEHWDYWLNLSRFNTDGMVLSDDFQATKQENGLVRNNNASRQYDIQSRVNWTLFSLHSFSLQAGYTWMDKKQIPASIYEQQYRRFTDWKRYQLSFSSSLQLHYSLQSETSIYYNEYEDVYAEYSDPDYSNMFPQWPSTLNSWTSGISEQMKWQISDHWRNILGYRYEKQLYNRKDNGNYPDWTSNDQHTHQAVLQSEFEQGMFTFSVSCGLSLFRQKTRNEWINNLAPSLGLYYRNPGIADISFAYSRNIKYPTLHELFSASSGNENLIEESADKYEMNVKIPFVISPLAGALSQNFYYNRVKNLIEKVSDTYDNIRTLESWGYESTLTLHLLWDHKISYSLLKMSEENYRLLETPAHSLTITENIQLPWKLDFVYEINWNDRRKTLFTEDLPAYWIHSFRINRNFEQYRFTVGIDNLFDENYQEEYGYPGPGLNFIVAAEVEIF